MFSLPNLIRSGFFAAALLSSSAQLLAHPSPNSRVLLDFLPTCVHAELTLPLKELEIGFGKSLLTQPEQVVPKFGRAMKEYLAAHVQPETFDHQPWRVVVEDMKIKVGEEPPDLTATLRLIPPPGASARRFILNYSVINHEVISHYAFVSIRSDWDTAVFSSKPEPVGVIHFLTKSLTIDRTKGSWWQGFASVFKLGLQHIAEGTDHLLFLLVLFLPAPLVAAGRSWGRFGGLRRSIFQLLKIVSAFTIGHSLTLAIGAARWIVLPAAPVEVLIAFSILVSAVQAFRPIFAGREMWIAAGFGLVHGLAFAGGLAEYGFSPWHMVYTVLAFNLGIETMQLIVVGLTIPWLVMLSRTRFYTPVRVTGAVFAGTAAVGWIGERALHWPNPMDSAVNLLAHHALWLITTLAALAFAATWMRRRRYPDGLPA